MNTFSVSFNAGQGLGGLSVTQYACIGANVLFLASAIVTTFTSNIGGDPFAHFNSVPSWMFTGFCSFGVAAFNIVFTGTSWSRFRSVADSVPEPGYEDKRMLDLKTAFYLGTTIGGVFAAATAFLAIVWSRLAAENPPFLVPCAFGGLAVSVLPLVPPPQCSAWEGTNEMIFAVGSSTWP
ncbi:uncharacterized protein Z520_11781 [Fonsecaea multimorphosa CBS 102226]|uniref:Uncharacterized protein n=1 Tax=Fonsecaea multimorphosa CBS 102226 TaxID=1442371 RepID=A0A0D2I5D8_9EURO|nr:uncharacterized protein Z520_11781 [Fonsecaea multimorphosa CBS 102226]KIX92461.1 hypothetical protein Z520_11781 [Fonsecaea multimorphosa CBS 102226]OAL19577.1 hypothetical protein AYO22_09739 [Fonsecaea multimorphosa]